MEMIQVCIEKNTGKLLESISGGYTHSDPKVDDEEYRIKNLNILKQNKLDSGYTEEDIEVFWEPLEDFNQRLTARIETDMTYVNYRQNAYPPFIDLIDGMVKQQSPDSIIKAEGDAQVATYYTDCLLVKENIPKD